MWRSLPPVVLTWLGTCVLVGCRFGYEELPAAQRAAGEDDDTPEAPLDGGLAADGGDGADDPREDGDAAVETGDAAPAAEGDAGGIGYAPCASDATCSCTAFGGRSYRVCARPLAFADAASACQDAGLTLARIDSAAENAQLHAVMTSALGSGVLFAFLGASDAASEGRWRWLDGDEEFWIGDEGGSAVGGLYAQWDDNKPFGNSTRNCAGMLATGDWEDRSCTAENAYLCEGP
jgi:hypothetical protein